MKNIINEIIPVAEMHTMEIISRLKNQENFHYLGLFGLFDLMVSQFYEIISPCRVQIGLA